MKTPTDANFYRDTTRVYPVIERGEGVYLVDGKGKRYMDFGSAIGVTSLGYGVAPILDAMKAQIQKTTFVYNGAFTNRPRVELSDRLLALCPPEMGKVIFANSGSEANDVAVKIARQYHVETGRDTKWKVIARHMSYHGNTGIALSVGDRPSWSETFRCYFPESPRIPAPYCYRCPLGLQYPGCALRCAHALEEAIEHEGPDQVSAFMVEPITGTTAAGVTPPPEYYGIVRQICERHNVLLIADEVITGIGRTGRNLGMDHWDVTADITTLSKGLSAGYAPLSAVVVHRTVVDAIEEGSGAHTQGFTYSGNPLSCAAALAALQYIEERDLVRRAAELGVYLRERLETLRDTGIVGDIRGKGLLAGVELVRDPNSRAPFPAAARLTQRLVSAAYARGLMIVGGMGGCADGVNGDQIQLTPAFVFTEEQIDQAVSILKTALLEARDGASSTPENGGP